MPITKYINYKFENKTKALNHKKWLKFTYKYLKNTRRSTLDWTKNRVKMQRNHKKYKKKKLKVEARSECKR